MIPDIEVEVCLNDREKFKKFVNTVSLFEFDICIRSKDRTNTYDAKSIMGIISLDLSKPVIVSAHITDDESVAVFKKAMEEFNA